MKQNKNILIYFQKNALCIEKISENKLYILNTCNHYRKLGKNNLLFVVFQLVNLCNVLFFITFKFFCYFTNFVFIGLNP